MNVMEKSDLVYTIKYLKAAVRNGDYIRRCALGNVICVLEQALEGHIEDEQHPYLYLNVIKAPTPFDAAVEDCCTTVCNHYRQGSCHYGMFGKQNCPRIQAYMRGYEFEVFRKSQTP